MLAERRYVSVQSLPQGLESSVPRPVTRSIGQSTWISYLLCAGLIAALVVANYIWWIRNFLVSDSWMLLGMIGEPDWSLRDLLPFQRYPHAINSTQYYAPVLVTVYWLALKLGGFNPEPQNLLLIGLHLGTTLFLFATALQLTGSRLKATATGAIFAVHFASTEGVGWFGAVSHPAAGFFGAMSLALYARHLVTRQRIWWIGALAALLAASLTQVTAFPWFALLACLDIFYTRKTANPQGMRARLGVLALLFALLVPIQVAGVTWAGRGGYSYQLGPWVIRNLFFYPVSTVVPSLEGPSTSLTRDLVLAPVDRDAFTRLVGMTDAYTMLLASGLVLVTVALLWSRGGWLTRYCVVAFALSMTPFVPINGHGYRYLYVPLMFFSMAVAGTIVDVARQYRTSSPGTAWAVMAILPLFVVLSFVESQRQLFWWQQAGFIAHTSLQQLREMQPQFPGGAKVVFGGLPDTLHNTNAQVWRNGMKEAVRVVYGDRTLRVEAYTKEEVERLFREELKGAPNTYGFVWENWQFKRIAP